MNKLPVWLQWAILISLLIPPAVGMVWLVWYSIKTGLWIILLPSAILAGIIVYQRNKNGYYND